MGQPGDAAVVTAARAPTCPTPRNCWGSSRHCVGPHSLHSHTGSPRWSARCIGRCRHGRAPAGGRTSALQSAMGAAKALKPCQQLRIRGLRAPARSAPGPYDYSRYPHQMSLGRFRALDAHWGCAACRPMP
eukprot:scaffold472_cov109-Isochrysis_galbana.AAC.7